MSLDDIECYNIDDVPAVKDPKVGTPLFDTTTKDTDDAKYKIWRIQTLKGRNFGGKKIWQIL